MPRKRREIPSFFSFEIGPVRGIAESLSDEDWGRWSKRALNDLSCGCTRRDTDPRVRKMYDSAKESMDIEYERKRKWYEEQQQKKNPQDAPNGNAGEDIQDAGNGAASKTPTSCDQFKADGDTREDSLNIRDGRNAGKLESGTSANIYGDAPHREAGDESATVSKPFALDSLTRQGQTTAKTRDSLGRGRYQPPSLGPEDGTIHDQETTIEISTDEKRTGGHSPLSQYPSSRPPVRDRRVSGDVLNLAYSGEFQNVRLTQEQYNELGIKFGNQQKLNRAIDSLSCQIENGEKNPKNHYAELVKWSAYRDDMEEKEELRAATQPHFETVSEHNARIVRESDAWIHEYCQQQKKNRKAVNG